MSGSEQRSISLSRLAANRRTHLRLGVAVASMVFGTASTVAAASARGVGEAQPPFVVITVLSNRADLISDGNALVAIDIPTGYPARGMRVSVDGLDVTGSFAVRPNGVFEGLVNRLKLGRNTLRAVLPDGRGASIAITNHPNGGPVFAGPQVQPYTCQAGAVDHQCDQPAQYAFLYKSTDASKASLQPYDPQNPPSDVATTTTDQGVTVPFVVRQELGYQDRDQYKILTLFQPGKPWAPWAPQPQWNHKLLIPHGGSCGESYRPGDAPLLDYSGTFPENSGFEQSYVLALGRGFAVMSTALDNLGHNCNIVTEAESLVMAKEHLVETYGSLRYAIGTGCSGGSIVQQQVANAYPGIYQGLIVTCSFPDVWTTVTQILDYHVLNAYLQQPSKWAPGVVWTPAQYGPVEGNALPVDPIASDYAYWGDFTPQSNALFSTNACQGVPAAERYDAQANPGGVRCGLSDYMVNVFGVRQRAVWGPQEQALGHGFAGIAADNVGVQYGLGALQQGLISPAQFVDLNAKAGGETIDAQLTAKRLVADEPALAYAYRTGAINETTNLDQVAIIDSRGPDPGAVHDSYRTFALRARLDRTHGTHANQLVWEGPTALVADIHNADRSVLAIDRWLSAVEGDSRSRPLPERLIADRPADLGDECDDGNGDKISSGLCPDPVVPVYGTPRTVAGEPISTDQNKCQVVPLQRSAYSVTFTADQWTQLQQTFPGGVCDFSKAGVDQQPTIPWLTYQDVHGTVIYGGTPLGAAPPSIPFGPDEPSAQSATLPSTRPTPVGPLGALVLLGLLFGLRSARRRR